MEKNLHCNFIINYNKVAEKIESVQRFKFQNESVQFQADGKESSFNFSATILY